MIAMAPMNGALYESVQNLTTLNPTQLDFIDCIREMIAKK